MFTLQVINLVGPASQQDVEIAALFKDAQLNYGNNVLGVLATKWDEHNIYKRQAVEITTTTESYTTLTPTEEPIEDNFIYIAKGAELILKTCSNLDKFILLGKGMLYTTETPVLRISENSSENKELKMHSLVTSDEREQLFKLIITFIVPEGKVNYTFGFQELFETSIFVLALLAFPLPHRLWILVIE